MSFPPLIFPDKYKLFPFQFEGVKDCSTFGIQICMPRRLFALMKERSFIIIDRRFNTHSDIAFDVFRYILLELVKR